MEQKIFTPRVIMFLIVFAVIVFGIMFVLLYNGNDVINDSFKPNEQTSSIDRSLALKSLNEKYKTNNIEIKEVSYLEGAEIKYFNNTRREIEVEYPKIDGLKNQEVENKINEYLKNKAFELLPEEKHASKEVAYYIQGNFNNILSITYDVVTYIKNKEGELEYDKDATYGINIDLNTGNEIKFEELFLDNISIRNLLSEVAYTNFAWDEKYIWGTWDEETQTMNPIDRSDLEDKVFKVLHKIDKGDFEFVVSPVEIRLIVQIPGETYPSRMWIDVTENYEKLAMFKRFVKDENIYTNEYDNEKELYCGFWPYLAESFSEPTENLFIQIDEFFEVEDEQFDEDVKKMVSNRIKAEEEYAKKNKDKQIFLMIANETFRPWREYIDGYTWGAEHLGQHNVIIVRCEVPYDEKAKFEYLDYLRNAEYYGMTIGASEKYFKDKNIPHSYGSCGVKYRENPFEIIERNDNVIYDSDKKLLTEEEILNMTSDELNKAYNEIFARHGHDFKDKELKDYFFGYLWYMPEAGKEVTLEELSDIERQNLELIKKVKEGKEY